MKDECVRKREKEIEREKREDNVTAGVYLVLLETTFPNPRICPMDRGERDLGLGLGLGYKGSKDNARSFLLSLVVVLHW